MQSLAPDTAGPPALARRERLLIGVVLAANFVVATCGTMLTALVPDLSRSLQVSVAQVGQLVTLSGVVMCLMAPLAPVVARRIGRRQLLTATLAVQGLALLLSALQTTWGGLALGRALQSVGPAVFTAQAAALLGLLLPQRVGRVTATVYLGWPLALVLGTPAAAWFSAVVGWPWVFAFVGGCSLVAAVAVWQALAPFAAQVPPVVKAPWRGMAAGVRSCWLTTAMALAAQLVLLTYFTSYGRDVLQARPADMALALTALGALGVLGVARIGRVVDRLGAPRAVALCLGLMAVSMGAWPLATSLPLAMLVLAPWALAGFALNAAQQARLLALDAAGGARNIGLNTSFVYLGQALGAGLGGWWVAHHGYGSLGLAALGFLALAAVASWHSGAVARPDSPTGGRIDAA